MNNRHVFLTALFTAGLRVSYTAVHYTRVHSAQDTGRVPELFVNERNGLPRTRGLEGSGPAYASPGLCFKVTPSSHSLPGAPKALLTLPDPNTETTHQHCS